MLPAHPSAAAGSVAAGAPTTSSPYVTLVPGGPGGHIPGDASDGADFWGIGVAILAIVGAVVLVRLVFRTGRGRGRHVRR